MSAPRFAGHLGVRSPDAPLFAALGKSCQPVDQIALMGDLGFAGVADNFLMLRGPETQAAIGDALARRDMAMGSFVHDPLHWNQPGWSNGDALDAVDASIAAARASGCVTINCVTGLDTALDRSRQMHAVADNLRRAADRSGRHGIALCVETTHPDFAPGALVDRFVDALAIVRDADHPFVRFNFDIGHFAMLGEDVVAAIAQAHGRIGMVQAADVPGRVEPGAGTLDWPAIFAALADAQYDGLIELELEPAISGVEGERAMLARLARYE